MANRTEDLLARITDAELRAALEEDFRAVTGQRTFGLVFERHLPESVRLPGTPVRRGSTAVLRSDRGNEKLLRVTRVSRGVATCRIDENGSAPAEHPVSDLVAVAQFGEPVFPGLEHVGTAEGPERRDDPAHLVIEGENFHALQALEYTHAGKVDLIYIDPPYNTGNKDWIYNDRYVGAEDAFRSSKWLSFMERRLEIARELLSPTGVIFVAIGDDEHHRLRMLMDQVFGPQNFISNIVWQGGRKNDSRYVSNGADYMLVYAQNEEKLRLADRKWREKKLGVDAALAKAAEIWGENSADPSAASDAYQKWMRSEGKKLAEAGVLRYNKLDELGSPFNDDRDLSWPGGGGPRYEILHPITGRPVSIPRGGWRLSEGRMGEEIANGRVAFGPDEKKIPRGKTFLSEFTSQVATSVFDTARTRSGAHLHAVFGDKRFPFPKDHEVLMRWIRMAAPKDATVLDFFAGSGSTGEAVLRLNAEDGGTRKFILVTNNELNAKDDARLRKQGFEPGDPEYDQLGVFQHVTWPRLRTVLTGTRPDGSAYSDGLPGRIEAFKLTYQDPDQVADHHAFQAVSPLLWMMSGTAGKHLDSVGPRGWAASGNHVVITEPARAHEALAELDEQITTVFTVTDSDSEFASVTAMIPSTVESVRLYSHYLGQFLVNRDGR